MAAKLKKRALAELKTNVIVSSEESPKTLKLQTKKIKLEPRAEDEWVSLVEKASGSNEVLKLLVSITDLPSESLTHQQCHVYSTKLFQLLDLELDSGIRCMAFGCLRHLSRSKGAPQTRQLVDGVVASLGKTTSHKVVAGGLKLLTELATAAAEDVRADLVGVARKYLADTYHLVQSHSLRLLALATDPGGNPGRVLRDCFEYTRSEDARVRMAAFDAMLTLHGKGALPDPGTFSEICLSLGDDFEGVRKAAIRMVHIMSRTYPEEMVRLEGGQEELRLVDHAFGKICGAVDDISAQVRELAVRTMGTMRNVDSFFLYQTLDKKLMSNLRKKKSQHERMSELVASGEFSSGQKWADDAPKELLQSDTINLVSVGACGAFVHGLEDEFMAVRTASIDSLTALATDNSYLANMALDFLVDMLNDEIEDVRLNAIQSLKEINRHIVLREDQLETVLSALKDNSATVREGLHEALSTTSLATNVCLKMTIDCLLENLKKYQHDKRSILRCFRSLGLNHPELTLPLVPQLLELHPFFEKPEADIEDSSYVCLLVLVFNAATKSPTMTPLFDEHTVKHYRYLRHTNGDLVPKLLFERNALDEVGHSAAEDETQAGRFLRQVLERVGQVHLVDTSMKLSSLEMARGDLERLGEIEPRFLAPATFASLYVHSQMLIIKVISSNFWKNPTALATQQGNLVKTYITSLQQNYLRLLNLFVGLDHDEVALARRLKIYTLALELLFRVKGSNASALAQCENLLQEAKDLREFLGDGGPGDPLTESLLAELLHPEDPKPGALARVILPLFQKNHSIPSDVASARLSDLRMSGATIHRPSPSHDYTYKFLAGLVLGLEIDVEIRDVARLDTVRVRVKYPDQHVQLIIPRPGDFHQKSNSVRRLLTTVFISHSVWTDKCQVEIGLILDLTDQETKNSRKLANKSEHHTYIVELCQPVKVNMSPKPVRKNI